MIVDRDEILRGLRQEGEGLDAAVNAKYRNLLLGAAELIEMDANVREAQEERAAELEAAGKMLMGVLAKRICLVSECQVPSGTDLNDMNAVGEKMVEDIVSRAIRCGALKLERMPDIVHACQRVRVTLMVMAEKLPEEIEDG